MTAIAGLQIRNSATARAFLVIAPLLVGVFVGVRAWSTDCWFYCESKSPPKELAFALGHIGKFAATYGIPVRTVNALGGKLLGGGYVAGSQEFTSSGILSVPQAVTVVAAEVVGGGGGGGLGSVESFPTILTGGGAGGGGYAHGAYAVVPYQTLSITVGAGGVPANPGGTSPSGGTTSVGSFISATGGGGGTAQSNGGAPGSGGLGSGGTTVNRAGGIGAPGVVNAGQTWRGGGGAGGPSANGSDGSGSTGGASGGVPGGAGSSNNSAGSNFGGGGSGGSGGSGFDSSSGGPGYARVSW